MLQLKTKTYPQPSITPNYAQDDHFSPASISLLGAYYQGEGEQSPQDAFLRAAIAYSYGDMEFAERIYTYASKRWFGNASPVLSNAPKGIWSENVTNWDNTPEGKQARKSLWVGEHPKAMPISCFLSFIGDTIQEQIGGTVELANLSISGGGVGQHINIRAVSEKAPGPIPYLKTVDASIGYYKQGKTRKGSVAAYLDISHPDIVEFIRFRLPTGGDATRKADNRKSFNNAVNITERFVRALEEDADWNLLCPHSGEIRETLRARKLWELILDVRGLTGEPYLNFIDVAYEDLPEAQKNAGLKLYGSNLCNEIHRPTNEERTAVCCLSSVNLELFHEWEHDPLFIKDMIRYLDNVMQLFIDFAPDFMAKAIFAATQERPLGLGVMGFHAALQQRGIAWETGGVGSAVQLNHRMFKNICVRAKEATQELAKERGECPDAKGTGVRNMALTAVAPTANNALIIGTSPGIDPWAANAFAQPTRAGTFIMKNKNLDVLFDKKGFTSDQKDELWRLIVQSEGSVQMLPDDILAPEEKLVYKTANELDQHWLVQHAEDRQQYICQGQSLNVFFPPGSDKGYINSVHLKAAKGRKVKGLYYLRTDNSAKAHSIKPIDRKALEDWKETEECISCQG